MAWDDEDEPPKIAARGTFDDEEEDDNVLDSWDAAEDSEVEREKAKKAEEARVKAVEKAKAEHKSKTQRIEDKQKIKLRQAMSGEDVSEDEESDDATRRARARQSELESDMHHAADLFGSIGVNPNRGAAKPVTIKDSSDPTKSIELSSLSLFAPSTLDDFYALKETMVPLIARNSKKAHYATFLPDFVKQLAKDLNSEQIRKVASGLTTLSNERMKEEKASDKTGKKSKAAKTKSSLAAARDTSRADTTAYDDGLDEDDFM